jgi:hypothetical protein
MDVTFRSPMTTFGRLPLDWAVPPPLIVPTFGGHLQKGILAPNEVFYGTQRLQAIQP